MTDFLLIHGAGHGAWVWDEVKGAIENSMRAKTKIHHHLYSPGTILAPDLPGHGARYSVDDPVRLNFDDAVDSLLNQIEAFGLKKPVVVAHDLSGLIALELIRRMEEPPKGLLLVGAAVPDLFHTVGEMLPLPIRILLAGLRFLPGTPPESVVLHKEIGGRILCSDMPYSWASSRVVGRLCPIPLRVFDALPHPDALAPSCPVTYAVLARDWYIWPGSQRKMASSFPNARTVELDSGHEAPITHSAEITELVMAFG
jgi:pimeloyl-ACP methyl ester carboxylesterase